MLHPQSRAGSLSAHGPCAIIGKVIEPQIINLKGNFLNLMQTTDLSLNLIDPFNQKGTFQISWKKKTHLFPKSFQKKPR